MATKYVQSETENPKLILCMICFCNRNQFPCVEALTLKAADKVTEKLVS